MRDELNPAEVIELKSREINQAGSGAVVDEMLGARVDPTVLAQNDDAAVDALAATRRTAGADGAPGVTGGYETALPAGGVDRGRPGAGPSRPGRRAQPVPDAAVHGSGDGRP